MGIIIGGLFVVIFCIFPVMYAARALGAGKSDLIDCIVAILVVTLISSIVIPFLPGARTSEFLSFTYGILVAGLIYKHLLQATYLASVLIAAFSTFISFLSLYMVDKIIT